MMNIIALVVVFINIDSFLAVFGANADVIGYASDYLEIILLGFIFQMMSFILMNFVRAEGQPILSMVSMITSTVLNIVLDYIFIVVLRMGVQGAAYATILGQFAGFSILISFYLRRKSELKFHVKDIIPDFNLIRQILAIGFSSFISIIGTSITMTIINRLLGTYGGTAAITSMGAINSLFTFVNATNGYNRGFTTHNWV